MTSPKRPRRASPKPKKRASKTHGGRRKGAGRKAANHLDDYLAIGTPPTDALRATEWGMSILTTMIDKVRTAKMPEPARRTELTKLLRQMKELVPVSRISAAERIILEDAQRRQSSAAPVVGSEELSDASAVDPAPLAAGPRAPGHR